MASNYTAKDITVLEGLEPVRQRPAMYIGGTDSAGYHHLLWEIVDNGVDEALGGHCDRIEVELHADGSIEVRDNGRGLDPATLRRAGELGFSTRASGAGLGLFLLRRAVSARGGAVVLQALPRGAEATVFLPLNAPSR